MLKFPEEWNEPKVSSKKKRRVDADAEPAAARTCLPLQGESVLAVPQNTYTELPATVERIMQAIQQSQQSSVLHNDFSLDAVLSSVSFGEILSNFFQRGDVNPDFRVPLVSKVYEESFLREPRQDERPCVNRSLCEGNFIDPKKPFVLVEFLLPNEPLPATPQFCVLCSRKITQKLFYDILFLGKEYHACIQRYGNICNIPGEYARECMLVCPPHAPLHCMPLPIMSHQRNKYEVYSCSGTRMLRQLKVAYEDFCAPSTKE